jgi:predicted nucleic acid-binding protein
VILVDTSVWIDFLRGAPVAASLASLLADGEVLAHPWVVGELALGHLGPRRGAILADLERLPRAPVATDAETRRLVEERGLAGSGIGWVDAGLLASALLAGARLRTSDRRLRTAGRALGVC